MSSVIEILRQAIFPKRCSVCGEVVAFDEEFCHLCVDDLPVIKPPLCLKCGCEKSNCVCKNHKQDIEYKAVIAPFYYENQIKVGVLNFKMHGFKNLYKSYGKFIADKVSEYYSLVNFDCVTYIPMMKSDEISREFNQSELLAKTVSNYIGVEFSKCLIKKRKTKTQKKQSAKERFANMYNAFDLYKNANVTGKTILLIDDVKTTGATLSSAALTLKAYGAKAVYCAVFAIVKDNKKRSTQVSTSLNGAPDRN